MMDCISGSTIGEMLDDALSLSISGRFEESKKLIETILVLEPFNERAIFNMGWHLMREGDLLSGHHMLTAGRPINVFGNRHPGTSLPVWDQQPGKVVLLYLEGGLGDQIHAARYAADIAEYDCKVVLACSQELASILIDVTGVSAVVQHEACIGVYHDYWLPSMSAPLVLGYGYEHVSGKPYIARSVKSQHHKIGIRFSGNPEFEHQQHRLFPRELMIDAVKDHRCISLQQDEEIRSMKNPCLDTWDDTRRAISDCDLVISSCTSVAHLSAAMGIETWIIVPVLPYYLWALPGNKTPYYDGVTLYRQQEYGNWNSVFEEIESDLNTREAA